MFGSVLLCTVFALPGKAADQVNLRVRDNYQARLRLIAEHDQALSTRLQTIDMLGATHDVTLVQPLKALLERAKPDARQFHTWNAAGYERVVDLRLISALHSLGDVSEAYRIGPLVRDAKEGGTEPVDEASQAASTILALGLVGPIRDVTGLLRIAAGHVQWNAVKVLDQLHLPRRPVAQDVDDLETMKLVVSFTASRLKEEMKALVSVSHSIIHLSQGVKDLIDQKDYDRGAVKYESRTLVDIIHQILPLLHFDYYLSGDHVVICTVQEAAARWEDWWNNYGGGLRFAEDRTGFIFVSNPSIFKPGSWPSAFAQAKISYLGEQTTPIPTVIFGVENRELDILRRLPGEYPQVLYTNDELPYTKAFTVSGNEFRRMVSAALRTVPVSRHAAPDYLSFFVLMGQEGTSQAHEFLIPRLASAAFFQALLSELSPENKLGKSLLETQCQNVCPNLSKHASIHAR